MALGMGRLAATLCCYRRRFAPDATPRGDNVDSEEAVMSAAVRAGGGGGRPVSQHGAPYYPPSSSDGASDGTPSEEHPEFVEICVVLPDGNAIPVTVEYGKQMMDLLVQVAAGNKLSPASHTIHVFDDDSGRQVEYKASQSVGSLRATTLHLVSKKNDKRKADRPKSVQPFEKTQRLTVNLPRNQKFVTRVNPKLTLADIYKMVCTEKKLDPYKYDLRHPTRPDHALNMAEPLGTYGISEIFVVSVGASETRAAADLSLTSAEVESSATMPRLSRKSSSSAGADEGALSYMPGQDGEKKKKKGFLSFLSKKKAGSFKLGATTASDPVYVRSSSQDTHVPHVVAPSPASPTQSTSTRSLSAGSGASGAHSPSREEVTVMTQSRTISLQKAAPSRRKRAAPAPPPPSQSGSGRSAPAPPAPTPTPTPAKPTTLNHSRNSSHSSGFDESNVSPIESPGTSTRTDVSAKTITSIDVTSIESSVVDGQQLQQQQVVHIERSMTKSQSLPVVETPKAAPTSRPQTQLISSASLNTLKRKKRKAPAPPPPPGALKSRTAHTPIPDAGPTSVRGATSTQQHVEVVMSSQQITTSFDEGDSGLQSSGVQGVDQLAPHSVLVNGCDEMLDDAVFISTTAGKEEKDAPLSEITKGTDLDDGASASSGSLERRRPCQFVPPPPPDTPPPPETPISHERAKSFNFSTPGVVDFSIQAHAASPCSEGDSSYPSIANESVVSVGTDDGDDLTSDGSSVQAYEVNAEPDVIDGDEEKKDGEKQESEDEDLPSYPTDPEGIVLIKKTSMSDLHTDNLFTHKKAEKEEINERKIRSSLETELQDHVTVVAIGGDASDSGHSSGMMEKSEETSVDVLENEITFDDDEVLYVEPLNPGNPVAKEEYLNQVERERIESVAAAEELEIQLKLRETAEVEERQLRLSMVKEEESIQHKLQEARDAAARASDVYEQTKTPVKSPPAHDGPLTTSTPVVESVSSSLPYPDESSFLRSPSPVLPTAEVEETKDRKLSESLSEEGDVFANPTEPVFMINDYRIVGLIKEEVIEFSFPKHNKPVVQVKEVVEELSSDVPMVTSLRQRYTKRPIVPREPLDVPDLEAIGLLAPKKDFPPPPAEPAPPIPSEPLEPLFICQDPPKPVHDTQKIYIKPAQESMTDPDDDIVIEVTEISSPAWDDVPSELSIPNEAEPETLERDKAYSSSYHVLCTDNANEQKPTGILKHSSSYSDSSSAPVPTKSILKSPSADHEQEKPVGILKNKEASGRGYSSMTSLDTDDQESAIYKPYASITNLASDEKDQDTQVSKPSLKYGKRGLGVYGPRPWGGSRFKSDTNNLEEINTKFSDRYNNNDPVSSPTTKGEDVRQRMAELGFSPGTETERENVLEEKSLSMMNLKTVHSSVGADNRNNCEEDSSLPWLKNKGGDMRIKTEQVTHARPHSMSSIGTDDSEDKSLQTQYEELEKKFHRWKKQLQENQELLTQKSLLTQNILPKKELVHQAPANVKILESTQTPIHSSIKPAVCKAEAMASSPAHRHIDARYEPPKKTTPDTGGGGRFTTNDLLTARSRLKSNGVDENDEVEKCGVMVGHVVDTVPRPGVVSSAGAFGSPIAPPAPSLPRTPAPDTKDFPPPPRRVIIQPPVPKNERSPSRFEPRLDPREELMITIRNSGGRTGLRKVPVNQTKWYSRTPPPEN